MAADTMVLGAPTREPIRSTVHAPANAQEEARASYRLSVAQYEAMGRAGILTKNDRVELRDGLLVRKMTKNPPHQVVISHFNYLLTRALPDGWLVRLESPLVLAESVPEPDVMVLRGRDEDYEARHPRPEDVALLVEVADTSVAEDQAFGTRYAEAAVPCYLIANLPAARIEVYTDPTGPDPTPAYRSRRDHPLGSDITLTLLDGGTYRFAVADFFPRRGH